MPVVKGGVWTNIEDEILKASVSKYGLNQWARVSSLLARKTPKQCKARWSEWLDPGIRKIEWSKEEDEKLLHLAKLMPTQWRTIAPIVGRTATQCLERYQKLLDEAEARENDELGLGGPTGGETAAPSADDVRRLRPGELDPDPESKPARPDTVDLDEDEKEMLSEARARLANTQGKKAKRKARERQLEESRRLAQLQKRRELKSAGINIKVVTRKPGQMDYNADIPFEKAPAAGFYDTAEEETRNERQRLAFDPRKQQLANKRKGDGNDDDADERKRQKNDKNSGSAAFAAAAKAGQMQKIREAERSSRRKGLNLPAPQVGESELEDIVKMGMAGARATQSATGADNEATRGLVGRYDGIVGGTPIRTPRAPQEEDRIANEIKNARARTETQSALLGGDNADLHEGDSTTGYQGIAPTKQATATPNPMATPFRQGGATNGIAGMTPRGPGETPMRTPRDNFRLNDQTPVVGQTPREVKMQEQAARNTLRGRLAALPKPKETEWELELPEDQQETASTTGSNQQVEDASLRDERNAQIRLANELADFKRQTQAIQRSLPRPTSVNLPALLKDAETLSNPAETALAKEAAILIFHDTKKFPQSKTKASDTQPSPVLQPFSDDELASAKMEIALEASALSSSSQDDLAAFEHAWTSLHLSDPVSSLATNTKVSSPTDSLTEPEKQLYTSMFNKTLTPLSALAEQLSTTEKTLSLHQNGYVKRSQVLRGKMAEAHAALEERRVELLTSRVAGVAEDAAMGERLERLRGEVQVVARRERVAQELYRSLKEELDSLA